MTGCDTMNGRRNKIIEADLQSVLDEGGNVWAIGDVHGYAQTLVTLLHSLDLTQRPCCTARRSSRPRPNS